VKRVSWILTIPLAVVIVVFATTNRRWVVVDLWPLELSVDLPLFVLILGCLFVGLIAGSAITWLSAAKSRHGGRKAARRVTELEREVARLDRERGSRARQAGPAGANGRPALPVASGEPGARPGPPDAGP
jgi:uncharacterized integral membrane protein